MSDSTGTQMLDSYSEDAFSPGAVLRSAREARGLSIDEVAHALKLAKRQIEAIEADAFDQLRGLTFARGFVRNYARYLGIDPEPLLGAIVPTSDPRQVELAPVSNARGEMPTAGSSLGSLLPAGITLVVLITIAFAGWHFGWFRVPLPDISAERVDRTESASLPARDEKRDEAIASSPAPAPDAVPTQVAPPGSPVAATPAIPAPALPAPVAEAAGVPASEPAAVAKAPPAPGMQRLAFEFVQDSWVEIKDAQGRIVHSQLHKGGSAEDVDVGGKPPYALVIGNAEKVKLRFNDKQVDLSPFVKISVARLSLQ